MKHDLIAQGIPELLPMDRSGDPTSHISYIIRYLCIKLGHFEPDEDTGEPIDLTLLELGSAWERAVVNALCQRYAETHPDRYLQIGELVKDGLIGTPDLADLIDWAILEIKLTKLSLRHDFDSDKFWKYRVQLMAYCYMLGTLKGELHVCHINGDYKMSRSPVYNVWMVEFTPNELRDNWRMLLTNQKVMLREGK